MGDLCAALRAAPCVLALAATACGTDSDAGAFAQRAVIVGSDDRREAYEINPELAPLARATAALVHAHHLLFQGDAGLTLAALPASQAHDLCPGERFEDQPAAAFCSAVLIDDTLAVTAGHCLGSDRESARGVCAEMRVLFGFELAEAGAAVALDADDVFSCRRVVLLRREPGDFAVIELDRPVTPRRQPVAAAAARPQAGDRLVVASHGAGLPLKVELAAEVVDSPAAGEFFVAASDTFAGGSGGGLFGAGGALAGVVVRGHPDWQISSEACARPARVSAAAEQHQHADRIGAALTAIGWPSPRLSGVPHRCGDGVCGPLESGDGCATDCSAPACGDLVCEPAEREACHQDCHRYDHVPPTWPGAPTSFPPPPDSGCALAGAGGLDGTAASFFVAAALSLVEARRWRWRRRAVTPSRASRMD